MNDKLKEQIIKSNGDIFGIFISIYDLMDKNCLENENMEFYKKIFENVKTSEDSNLFRKFIHEEPKKIKDFYEYIDKENLNISSKEDLETIEKILFTITTKAIVMRFKYSSNSKARDEYLKQIEYLKYGMLKKKEGTQC